MTETDNEREKQQNPNRSFTSMFYILALILTLVGVATMVSAGHMMLAEREYWEEVSRQLVKSNLPIPPKRGDIFACNGELLATSLPEYKIRMDFSDPVCSTEREKTKILEWRDTTFWQKLDSMANGLHEIFPKYSADYFRKRLKDGFTAEKPSRAWLLYPGRATYVEYKACAQLPYFKNWRRSGFYGEKLNQRIRPYGGLAQRVIGAVKAETGDARFGLEMAFDTVLRGTPGAMHMVKVRNRHVSFVDRPPVDGHDLLTTIDINLQDVAEKALRTQMPLVNAEWGTVVVMDVPTGDIKAMVNLGYAGDGTLCEMQNYALCMRMEPGSTFKTASYVVGLEDGAFTPDTRVETGGGRVMMHGRSMTDSHANHTLTARKVIEQSSNIGMSKLIDSFYHGNPEKYVDGLNRIGVGVPVDMGFKGTSEPMVRHPNPKNWYRTTLAWMSIGYETLIPPIYTLMFYNALANNGCMVKPRFVTAELVDGEVVKEYPVEVIREKICSDNTLAEVKLALQDVVDNGTARRHVKNPYFNVCGKTGTAHVADPVLGTYNTSPAHYFVSFVGFFPAENPRYTCIVAIKRSGSRGSGGSQAGPVFLSVAKAAMAQGEFRAPHSDNDSTLMCHPQGRMGNSLRTSHVVDSLGGRYSTLPQMADSVDMGHVPNLKGMPARDAVEALRQRGMQVRIKGSGAVMQQSLTPGREASDGTLIDLTLHDGKKN